MTTARTTVPTRYPLVYCAVFGGVAGVLVGMALVVVTPSAAGPVAGLVQPGTVVRFGIPLVRTLLDLSAAVAVGLSLLPKLLGFDRPGQTEPIMRVARPAAVVAAGVWAVAALVSVVLQAAEVRPDQPLTTGAVLAYVAEVAAGKGLLLSAGLAVCAALVGVLAVRRGESVPAELRILLTLCGLLPMPLTGHASNWQYHDLTMISMELHVLGAAAWAGGLAAVVGLVAFRRGLLASVLPRFSRLATLCLVLVAVTGLVNGLIELAVNPVVHLPASLVTTGYGLVLLGKIGCAAVLAALGGHIRWRLMPRIVRHQVTALLGWAAFEMVVMGLAFGLAVVLSRAPVA
ncbi:copper resistance D family protein [Goodfellowiella coeruleoviolacea]|uniref:Copper resistance protein D n=1 Tax=Goodfellowiella coeruleoviolacea TaxID=334858 RepID=A0AAE3KJG0_9PSEU|nr:CopD family protein [Goodfellowiella coeruleoviolacea]MCP2169042.1 putative copper resistance protein D [Goodfellowiella coeruleoviolacea]